MTDDEMPKANDRSEPPKPESDDRQVQQSQISAATRPAQPAAPGRRPLFRS